MSDQEPSETEFVVIRPQGDITENDLASVFEGEWRKRVDLADETGIDLDGPNGVVRALPTDRVEQAPDGTLGQVYLVPDSG